MSKRSSQEGMEVVHQHLTQSNIHAWTILFMLSLWEAPLVQFSLSLFQRLFLYFLGGHGGLRPIPQLQKDDGVANMEGSGAVNC